MKKVSFHTLGCRLNFSESGSIAQGFADRGYQIVEFDEPSDVVFLNTCTVTDGADSSCRNIIRKAQKTSPEAKIVVAGCYAQMESEKIQQMKGIDLILGTSEKYKVFDYLDEDTETLVRIDKSNEFWASATTPVDSHTRAFLKIQDGCNYVCSFCIIPFARGRSRTITVSEAKNQAMDLVEQGYKEIVLTGVNIGEYETTSKEKLSDLISEIVSIESLQRLRLSSVEPNTITDELLDVLSSSNKYMDHFHVPMQSGDDEILKSMRRKYDVAFYKDVISKIAKTFPETSIGADVIAGYPGETEEQFLNTYNLLSELPITHFHVFPYSKRKGTTAAGADDHITNDVKKKRVKRLIALGEEKLARFSNNMIGKKTSVLFEKNKAKHAVGNTSNFIKIKVETDVDMHNEICDVLCTHFESGQLFGELVQ
jgi:threonylcarbamoyladenosine tRNA methylthiotransferase MtaB